MPSPLRQALSAFGKIEFCCGVDLQPVLPRLKMIQSFLSIQLRSAHVFVALWLCQFIPGVTASEIEFNRDIRPLLADNCLVCHGPDANHRKAELRLDVREAAIEMEAIVPGKPEESVLIQRIFSDDPELQMPPPNSPGSLSEAEKQLLRRWVAEGANYQRHWAFIPPQRPALPHRFTRLGANPIDLFLLRRLDREGWSFSPVASKQTLIRRVSLDLTGLPPTPAEQAAFLADDAPGAYARVVDRLLSSPGFGQRMAWDWMEVARYADSNGYQGDRERTMWPWRDWVVDAFNQNMPYDQFTTWQLAGDLLPNATFEQKLATGFCRNHPINGEGGRIPEENRIDYVMDMAETTATVWLGVTLTCARCHDHKFDPITRQEYYQLFAYFDQTPVNGGGGDPQTAPVVEYVSPVNKLRLAELSTQIEQAIKHVSALEETLFATSNEEATRVSPATGTSPPPPVTKRVQAILDQPVAKRDVGKLSELEKAFDEHRPEYVAGIRTLREKKQQQAAIKKATPKVMVMASLAKSRKTFMLDKGLYNKPGDEVSIGTPASLSKLPEQAPGNRLGLANWLTEDDHPLTARVTVNRFWQMFFGTGLVKTAEDFGVQGELPSHPELLDWLAVEFRDSGWDVKRLVRLIVSSNAYQQTSRVSPERLSRDPENRLLSRGARFRMPSWMLRDQALAVSGLLIRQQGGPPVRPYQPDGIWEEATFGKKKYVQDKGAALYRRSLYTFWRRIVGPTVFFDTGSRLVCEVKPTRTNSPLHALATLNDTTYVEAARELAARVLRQRDSNRDRLMLAFQFVLSRTPQPVETDTLLAGLARVRSEFSADPDAAAQFLAVGESPRDVKLAAVDQAAWATICLAIMNLDETLTKE